MIELGQRVQVFTGAGEVRRLWFIGHVIDYRPGWQRWAILPPLPLGNDLFMISAEDIEVDDVELQEGRIGAVSN